MTDTPTINYTDAELKRAEAIVQDHQRRKNALEFEKYRQRYEGKFFKCNSAQFEHGATEPRWRYVAYTEVTEQDRKGFSFGITRTGDIVVCHTPSFASGEILFGGDLIAITPEEFWSEAQRHVSLVRKQLEQSS